MLTKTITTLGNTNCIPLDKTMSEQLGVEKGSVVKIRFEGSKMIVEPISSAELDDKIVEAGKRVSKKHSRAMKRLAEGK